MSARGFTTTYSRAAPSDSVLAPGTDIAGDSTAQGGGEAVPTFTDTSIMPTGNIRRVFLPGGCFYTFGYMVPIASSITRHFMMFASATKVGCTLACMACG